MGRMNTMKTGRQIKFVETVRVRFVLSVAFLAVLVLSSCAPQNPFPLSEPGPYGYGTKGAFSEMYSFIDTNRADRAVEIMVWYQDKVQANATSTTYNIDAEADPSGAPYPLILSSAKVASYFG